MTNARSSCSLATLNSSLHEPSISTPPRARHVEHTAAAESRGYRKINGVLPLPTTNIDALPRRRSGPSAGATAARRHFTKRRRRRAPRTTNSKNGRGPHRRPLLNLGGPETSEDVEPFLYNLFADPDIIRLPPALAGLQTAIAWLVAKRRAPKSRAAYDSIGGGSPILEYTTQQAKLARERDSARTTSATSRCATGTRLPMMRSKRPWPTAARRPSCCPCTRTFPFLLPVLRRRLL